MGCTSNAVDQAQNPRHKARKAVRAISVRAAKLAEFETFGDEIRQELDPTGALERLLADYVTQVAWRLKTAIERQENREAESSKLDDPKSSRIRPTAIEAAARTLREAFEAFEVCRALTNPRTTSALLLEVRSEPEVVSPVVEDLEPAIEDEEIAHWRDRLTFDFEVSDISPVVKGTWVTVGHVVSLIVDGWTWADILRSHPELCEDDIRSCVTYAMDEENDPGNPEI
jgi:uncharacterized protein (DUF433 family)